MKYEDYGNTSSKHGWEVDHIKPVSKGGTDDLSNLQPLQWDNNRKKSDTYLMCSQSYCGVESPRRRASRSLSYAKAPGAGSQADCG